MPPRARHSAVQAPRVDTVEVAGFDLSDDEMARTDGLNEGRRLIDPPFGPDWDPA